MGWFGSKDTKGSVSREISALEAAGDVDGLIKELRSVYPLVRQDAAQALGVMGDRYAVEPLLQALEDDDWNVRRKAVVALGNIGDAYAVEPLLQALEDEHTKIRIVAIEALGKIGDARAVDPLAEAVEPLIKALGAEDRDVRLDAAMGLAMIGEPGILPLIKVLKKGRTEVFPALEKMPPAAVGAEFERLELYGDAETWYTSHGMLEAASFMRRKKVEMAASKTEIHGDYVDDRDTIIKDSVISKSNIGAGGDDKFTKLDRLAEMKEKGLIDDDEFQQMKKEILGK